MKEKLESVINRILIKNHPVIEELQEIKDLGTELEVEGLENSFKVYFKLSKPTHPNDLITVMDELGLLFKMLVPSRKSYYDFAPKLCCKFIHGDRIIQRVTSSR